MLVKNAFLCWDRWGLGNEKRISCFPESLPQGGLSSTNQTVDINFSLILWAWLIQAKKGDNWEMLISWLQMLQAKQYYEKHYWNLSASSLRCLDMYLGLCIYLGPERLFLCILAIKKEREIQIHFIHRSWTKVIYRQQKVWRKGNYLKGMGDKFLMPPGVVFE